MATKGNQPPVRTLYGPAITEAIASGDLEAMKKIREEALDVLASAAEVEKLLPQLDQALSAKGWDGPIVLYGVVIQDAAARGDKTELARLKAEVDYYSRLLS